MHRTIAATIAFIAAALLLSIPVEAQQADVTRYVRYEEAGSVHWGILEDETIHQLGDAPYLEGARTGQSVALADVTLRAPVDPRNLVVMTALNFRSHLGGRPPASYPGLFIVPPNSIIGPDEPIVRPAGSTNLHYEAEGVVVIGRRARNIAYEDAHEYIFGVTAGNDVTDRTWQARDRQWARGKGTDTFNPVGPVLVRGIDYNNLMIVGRLNGDERQRESTADMLFDFHHMVAYVSRYMTLEPGDLIWSGTMGVTRAMEPGDVYEVEMEGVGVLRNPVVQAPAVTADAR